MATHQLTHPDGTTLAITMIGAEQVNAAKYDAATGQPPGGNQALTLGTGLPQPTSPQVTCWVSGATQAAARLAKGTLYDFAVDATTLERILPTGNITVLSMPGAGESVAGMRVTALDPFGLNFSVALTFRPRIVGAPLWHPLADAGGGLADSVSVIAGPA